MDVHQRFNKISEIPLDDWSKFENGVSLKKIKEADFFLREGQISNHIGFVIKGIFRLFHLTEKKEVNYNFFAEGQFVVDYESFLQEQPSEFMIQALEESEVLLFSKSQLHELYESSHAWERFGRKISEQIFLKSRIRLKDLILLSAEQRYLNFIKNNSHLSARLPLYHIASYLGIDPTSLSRIRKDISKRIS